MPYTDWQEVGDGCKCWVNPNPYTHYGITEPGDALEWNPECPEHPGDIWHCPGCHVPLLDGSTYCRACDGPANGVF